MTALHGQYQPLIYQGYMHTASAPSDLSCGDQRKIPEVHHAKYQTTFRYHQSQP